MPIADSGYTNQATLNYKIHQKLLADIKAGKGLPIRQTTMARGLFDQHFLDAITAANRKAGAVRSGKGVKIGPLKKGALNGYHLGLLASERRAILMRDLQSSGYTKTIKRLIALKTYNKNRLANKKKVNSDIVWIRKMK